MNKFNVLAILLIAIFVGGLGGAVYHSNTSTANAVAALEDTVIIDYVGTVDGVEFDGGTANDYSLVLGSGSFIDGFEDQIVGHKVGDKFDVNVTFPEDYSSEDLQGKDAVFAVNLKEIQKP